MGKYLDKVQEIRNNPDKHYSCTQSVLMAFAEPIGLSEAQCKQLGSHFGGGMFMGSVCGSITGGLMVLGLLGKRDKETRDAFIAHFKDAHCGMYECRDLLKANMEKGIEKKVHCDGLVYEVVSYIEALL